MSRIQMKQKCHLILCRIHCLQKMEKRLPHAADWNNKQRPYIYHLFEENVYGRFPLTKIPLKFVSKRN